MAEINERPVARHSDRKQFHRPKRSTRVDLTPMVDLGFLLLTFFVFTSALSTPMAMKLEVPNDTSKDIYDDVCESCVLTVLLHKDKQAWYSVGKEGYDRNRRTDLSPTGIRRLLQKTKAASIKNRGSDQFVVIIKPSPESNFESLIDVIDECAITSVKRYYIDELMPADRAWLKLIN